MRSSGLVILALALSACTRAGVSTTPLTVPLATQVTADERTLIAAAVDTIMDREEGPGTVCVAILGGPAGAEEPDSSLLEALRSNARFVAHSQCPPTYASIVSTVDSGGRVVDQRPPGYVDPLQLWVGRPQFESRGYGWLYARQLQGTSGRDYLCMVEQHPPAPARAYCRSRATWVH